MWGTPSARLLAFVADLLARVPTDDREDVARGWLANEPSLSGKLAVFKVANRTDEFGHTLLPQSLVDEVLDVIVDGVVATEPAALLKIPDVGHLLWLACSRLGDTDRDRLHAFLSPDAIFLRYLVTFLGPHFIGMARSFEVSALAASAGQEWLQARLQSVEEPEAGSDEADALELARQAAAAAG